VRRWQAILAHWPRIRTFYRPLGRSDRRAGLPERETVHTTRPRRREPAAPDSAGARRGHVRREHRIDGAGEREPPPSCPIRRLEPSSRTSPADQQAASEGSRGRASSGRGRPQPMSRTSTLMYSTTRRSRRRRSGCLEQCLVSSEVISRLRRSSSVSSPLSVARTKRGGVTARAGNRSSARPSRLHLRISRSARVRLDNLRTPRRVEQQQVGHLARRPSSTAMRRGQKRRALMSNVSSCGSRRPSRRSPAQMLDDEMSRSRKRRSPQPARGVRGVSRRAGRRLGCLLVSMGCSRERCRHGDRLTSGPARASQEVVIGDGAVHRHLAQSRQPLSSTSRAVDQPVGESYQRRTRRTRDGRFAESASGGSRSAAPVVLTYSPLPFDSGAGARGRRSKSVAGARRCRSAPQDREKGGGFLRGVAGALTKADSFASTGPGR